MVKKQIKNNDAYDDKNPKKVKSSYKSIYGYQSSTEKCGKSVTKISTD